MKNNQLLKICSSCKQELEIIHFNKNKSSKDGLNNQCKECFKISAKKCYDNKKEKGLLRFQIKDEKYKASRQNDAIKYKEKIAEYKKEYRESNKEFLKETKRKYYVENKEQIRLIGSGATTITSDASGNVTISSTDNNTVYTHPSGDGNLHVPATGTSNDGKFLRAGSVAGSLS